MTGSATGLPWRGCQCQQRQQRRIVLAAVPPGAVAQVKISADTAGLAGEEMHHGLSPDDYRVLIRAEAKPYLHLVA